MSKRTTEERLDMLEKIVPQIFGTAINALNIANVSLVKLMPADQRAAAVRELDKQRQEFDNLKKLMELHFRG